jgi:hypothetical protein
MSTYDMSNNTINNTIFDTIHSELLNILFNNNNRQEPQTSRNTARRSRNHSVGSNREPSVGSHREPTTQNPYNYVYAMWRQYNSNIEQYQRIMETNVLPYVQNENEFYNISTTYNNNMYNYQLNFNGVMGNLMNNNYIYNPVPIGQRNAPVYAEPVITPIASRVPTATRNTNNDSQPGQYYRRNRPATPIPTYEYIIHSTFDLDLPEIPIPNSTNNYNSLRVTDITNEQILNATQMVPYDLSMNTTCPISYAEFVEGDLVCQIKQCKHVFKPYFIMNWLENYSAHCPVCRYDLRTYVLENIIV